MKSSHIPHVSSKSASTRDGASRDFDLGQGFLAIFERRFRGVRLIEIIGFAMALLMIFWLCLSKVREGEDVERLKKINAQIEEQQARVNSLKLIVSHLERPKRLEALASGVLNMQSVKPDHEADMESLIEISRTGSKAVAHPSSFSTEMPVVMQASVVELPSHQGLQTPPSAVPVISTKPTVESAVSKPQAPRPVDRSGSKTSGGLKIEVVDPHAIQGGH